MDQWLMEILQCPRHQATLSLFESELSCGDGCRYPVVDGVPVLLLPDARQTIELAGTSWALSRIRNDDGGLYLDSLGISADEKRGILDLVEKRVAAVDPVVSYMVGATNGIAYKPLIGNLREYPIPSLMVPDAHGQIFLDIGCSWGRWSIAAARKGWKVIGIDPSLGAVMAARRVSKQLGVNSVFIVGDARFLPIRSASVDQVFSYSVIQHFSREDAHAAVKQIGRVLKDDGNGLVQMPIKYGLRCLYHQARRTFAEGVNFDVRYWTIPSLRRLFASAVGKTAFSVDCFFGIGLQMSDIHLMTLPLKIVIIVSEILRGISLLFRPLTYVADSVYVSSRRRPRGEH